MTPRRYRRELGQGLVEFAVIFPIFVLLVAIVFDVGLGFNRQATLQHAVREGARAASVRDNADGGDFVRQRTSDQAQSLVDPGDVFVCYEDMDGDGIGEGDAVNVQLTYEYQPLFLRTVSGLFGSDIATWDIDITGSARLEVDLDAGGDPC